MKKKVLVIDDDPSSGTLVELILKPLDIAVYLAYSGLDGLKLAYAVHPDLVILDVTMPGMDGFEVCSRLREFSDLPIMMLTARTQEKDVLRGFTAGANDYVGKPFRKAEFEARVLALLKRSENKKVGDSSYITGYADALMEIDFLSKSVKVEGRSVELSPKEFDLLECLVREQGNIISQRELLREVWGESSVNDPAESSLYIYYLRRKLRDGKLGHQYIRTHWGRGYWFEPRASVEEA